MCLNFPDTELIKINKLFLVDKLVIHRATLIKLYEYMFTKVDHKL